MGTHSGPERAQLGKDEPRSYLDRGSQQFAIPNPGRVVAVGGGPPSLSYEWSCECCGLPPQCAKLLWANWTSGRIPGLDAGPDEDDYSKRARDR